MQAGILFHLPIIKHFISSTTGCWDVTKPDKTLSPSPSSAWDLIHYPKHVDVSFILPWFWAWLTLVVRSPDLTPVPALCTPQPTLRNYHSQALTGTLYPSCINMLSCSNQWALSPRKAKKNKAKKRENQQVTIFQTFPLCLNLTVYKRVTN